MVTLTSPHDCYYAKEIKPGICSGGGRDENINEEEDLGKVLVKTAQEMLFLQKPDLLSAFPCCSDLRHVPENIRGACGFHSSSTKGFETPMCADCVRPHVLLGLGVLLVLPVGDREEDMVRTRDPKQPEKTHHEHRSDCRFVFQSALHPDEEKQT
ncbi:hypothetical protein D623_10011484 [Myotis brandtii]|uniref:Uncharacterized protein n=1 Tax=Myotis brandtii TaxID=109478 RepID=S7MW85_MYOBR|nr:hypothetical protein D623_10011484 [Myotis brandtii]